MATVFRGILPRERKMPVGRRRIRSSGRAHAAGRAATGEPLRRRDEGKCGGNREKAMRRGSLAAA